MTTSHQQDEVQDSTAQKEPVVSGFSTDSPYHHVDDDSRKEPTLGDLLDPAELAAAPVFTPPVEEEKPEAVAAEEPTVAGFGPLDAVAPLAGSPVSEPAAEPVLDPVQLLRRELAAAWGQDDVDNDAFEQVKHLTIAQTASDEGPLVVVDPVSDDEVRLGTREDGVQAVLGSTNITAAQALNRAQLAMTSERFRTEGVNEVHGTEMDKALLLLAAESTGLNIVNKPEISAEVMAQAKAQWDDMIAAKNAPAAEAVAAAPVAEEAVAAAPVAEAPVEKAVPAAAAIDLHEIAHDAAALPLIEVEELPADGIPVLTEVVEEAPTVATLKPEVQKILDGETEGDKIPDDIYLDLRSRIKAGDQTFTDDQGFILKRGITETFRERGIGTGRTQRLLEALEADGVTYNSARLTKAPRTVINYQVAPRPALRPE